ncbi:MAG: sodium/proline symporter PutP [Oscillospiraceae bacterium]|nr:sodium/proline symporter PutP [Oscillospiraceae bacterium]
MGDWSFEFALKMNDPQAKILFAMGLYMLAILVIGIVCAKRANKSSEDYFIGGRSLGPWVAAMSAEASDMSGWLLMGVPGLAYWCGLADAFWTALGLALGTYINWLVVSKRLRRYSLVVDNAITIPEFFSNRFRENKKIILTISSVFILIFFSVYVGSCFVTGGKLFSQLFGTDYHVMMIISALIVVIYTLLGGFLAESISDFVQGLVMIFALLAVLVFGIFSAGGIGEVAKNVGDIPGFVDFFGLAAPSVDASGVQLVAEGKPLFGDATPYGLLTIISTMSWGLGYFGMPQVLLRFMAIRKTSELRRSRIIATVWCVISLAAALVIGLISRSLFATNTELLTASGAENVFITFSQFLFHPIVAGIVMSAILAAAMSSSDSYLLIASSAVSKNIYQGLLKKNASEKQVMNVSRITLLVISIIGIVIAWNENSVIFKVVSFAWAGFGATFGPLMLLCLFWKRITRAGAVAGMVVGGGAVFVWKLLIRDLGGYFDIYELLPAFLLSALAIVIVSLVTKKPKQEVLDDFDAVKTVE